MSIVLGSRERSQPAPPHILWDTLTEPRRPAARPWLSLTAGEVEPTVVEASRPNLVVWSSLWPDRPHDRIRFEIRGDGGDGSRLRWTLETDGESPGEATIAGMRHRIDFLINGEMRYSFGQ